MPEIKEITVYKFEELSQKAKEKAMNEFLSGLDFAFEADFILEEFITELKAIGIYAERKNFSWSLDREWFFCLGKEAEFEDKKLFLKYAKIDLRKKFAKGILYGEDWISLEISYHSGGRCENYVKYRYDYSEELTSALQDKFQSFLKQLQAEYDNVTSEEYFKDMADANGWVFDEYGRIV
jgi:hypothetical protein